MLVEGHKFFGMVPARMLDAWYQAENIETDFDTTNGPD
jgi:hypothetical protein